MLEIPHIGFRIVLRDIFHFDDLEDREIRSIFLLVLLLAAFSVALCFSHFAAWNAHAQSTTDPRVTDFRTDGFYLPPFTRERRAELHSFHISNTNFSLRDKSPTISVERCSHILELAKKITPGEIMEPEISAWGVPLPESLKGQCPPDFRVDTDYYPSLEGWQTLDEAFGIRSSFLEAYDLSAFLGDGYYGILSDGGRPICREKPERPICTDMRGYSSSIKIANIKTCEISARKSSPYSMLRVSAKNQGKQIDQYQYGGFYAFINLNDMIYALAFRTDYLPDELCSKTSSGRTCPATRNLTDLFIYEFAKGELNEIQTEYCSFKPNINEED